MRNNSVGQFFYARNKGVDTVVLKATIMDENALSRAMMRISHEITEANSGAKNIIVVGIKRRGEALGRMICENIAKIEGKDKVDIPFVTLDISSYRDDYGKGDGIRHNGTGFSLAGSDKDFLPDVNGKTVILVDDVIYTGRTARAAIEALFSIGRPARIMLAILIDRGHRELPIRADFVGKNVPTAKSEFISVKMPEFDGNCCAELYGE